MDEHLLPGRAAGGVLDAREVWAYPTWYAQLGVLSRRPGWMSPLRDLVGYPQWDAFEAHKGVVHARIRDFLCAQWRKATPSHAFRLDPAPFRVPRLPPFQVHEGVHDRGQRLLPQVWSCVFEGGECA
jgi:hypothetical protein